MGSLYGLFEGTPCSFYVCYFSAIYLAMRLLHEIAFLKGRGTRHKFSCLVVIGEQVLEIAKLYMVYRIRFFLHGTFYRIFTVL